MPDVTLKLTGAQLNRIKEDMSEKVEMLNDAEINALTQQVNQSINLPFINEEKEFVVFAKVIKWVDRQLYRILPNEYYELVKDASDGISEEEADKIIERATPMINNVVNIPVLSEKQESTLIDLLLSLIIKAMVKGFKLEEVALA